MKAISYVSYKRNETVFGTVLAHHLSATKHKLKGGERRAENFLPGVSESNAGEAEKEEPPPAAVVEESHKITADDYKEKRSLAIAAKAREIEKVYRQDCETFGTVVKMLVAKDPDLEKQLQVPLRENLGEIRERCLEDLKHFINELDEAIRQPEPAVLGLETP
uniref:Periphilin 1 n=1 Tax=Hippocampus comes TaxID=109280 RepID=A0A3Q2XR01_HIPCM